MPLNIIYIFIITSVIKPFVSNKTMDDLGRGPPGIGKAEGDEGHPSLPC